MDDTQAAYVLFLLNAHVKTAHRLDLSRYYALKCAILDQLYKRNHCVGCLYDPHLEAYSLTFRLASFTYRWHRPALGIYYPTQPPPADLPDAPRYRPITPTLAQAFLLWLEQYAERGYQDLWNWTR